MSCCFCGNEKVGSYADCQCREATKMNNAMKKGKVVPSEQFTGNCPECNMMLCKADATKVLLTGVGLKEVYICPRCGDEQIVEFKE